MTDVKVDAQEPVPSGNEQDTGPDSRVRPELGTVALGGSKDVLDKLFQDLEQRYPEGVRKKATEENANNSEFDGMFNTADVTQRDFEGRTQVIHSKRLGSSIQIDKPTKNGPMAFSVEANVDRDGESTVTTSRRGEDGKLRRKVFSGDRAKTLADVAARKADKTIREELLDTNLPVDSTDAEAYEASKAGSTSVAPETPQAQVTPPPSAQ